MYISKIDDLIDNVIDDFYVSIILKNPVFKKIFKDKSFVRYQKDINDILFDYCKNINLVELKELVKNNESIYSIFEALKRYVSIYLFLAIGFHYVEKDDMYINNLVEFSQNQGEYNFKISNFFNSESNSVIVKYYFLVKNIMQIINADQQKIEILKKKPEILETIEFFKRNQLSNEYVNKNFKLEALKNNIDDQCHNIIKTIIILELYKVKEKKEFFRILEMTENLEGEYTFIDIVVPTKKTIDFSSIENVLDKKDIMKGMATKLWNFLQHHINNADFIEKYKSPEQKIIDLIESGIVYPICDDFLLYHKQSERYDRNLDIENIKKKEDTKIKYIVNKIELASELYSEVAKNDKKAHDNIKKQFSIPLLNRKVVLINDQEDMKLIDKYFKMGKRSVESNEFYQDLLNYKQYPYINFKDFENNGFSITINNTVNVVRSVNINQKGEFKQIGNNYIQTRSGSNSMILNVVGFVIPTNKKSVNCLKTRDLIDIRMLNKDKQNGIELVTEYLKETKLGDTLHNSSVYWLFDPNTDKVNLDKYEQTNKFSVAEQIKKVVAKLYDNIILEVYYEIIDQLESHKKINLQQAYRILESVEKYKLPLTRKSDLYNDLEIKIFDLIEKAKPDYDKKYDITYGITGDIVDLYEYKKNKEYETIKLSVNTGIIKSLLDEENDSDNVSDSVCQHFVSWNKIVDSQKTNPSKFSSKIFDFTQQYVTENVEQDYICKSCGSLLNIEKYVSDGKFSDSTGKFVAFATPMQIPLEDIEEYQKYKGTLRGLDKIIEKMASVCGIAYYTGPDSRSRRKLVVKDSIDLILLNNQMMKKIYEERNAVANKIYGINRNLSNFYVFILENAVFLYSSKDKDQYKPAKMNNIMTYILILLMLEINNSQIMYIGNSKKGVCNFPYFVKTKDTFFSGLKIRINDKGDLANILDYKILCYIIYILSCMVAQYMWYYDLPDPTKRKIHLPAIQKSVVHTVVDMLNGILEMAEKNNNYLYEIISTKYFKKIYSFYKDEEFYLKMQNNFMDKNIKQNVKTNIISDEFKKLSGKYIEQELDNSKYPFCKQIKLYGFNRNDLIDRSYSLSNLTNCKSGDFHNWSVKKNAKDNTLVCTKCNININQISNDKETENKIHSNYKYIRLNDIAKKICISDGLPHLFVYENIKGDYQICSKCKRYENHEYKKEELIELEKVIIKNKTELINNQMNEMKENNKLESNYENEQEKIVKNLEEMYNKHNKGTDELYFINDLIDEIHSVVGNESNFKDMFLKENAYIINHDHLGIKLDKPVVITDKDNKISYKNNHPFFNTDVIYYSTYKNGKIEIFYDASTKILLGYKEESKNFVLSKHQDKKIIINYSLMNKLKYMGYTNQFIDVKEIYDKYKSGREELTINNDEISKNIFTEILQNRLNNLKKLIVEFQRIFYSIIFETQNEEPLEDIEENYFTNKFNLLINKYTKKLVDITNSDSSGKNKIFNDWKIVSESILPKKVDTDIKFDIETNKILSVSHINKFDTQGNLLLFYIIEELLKLLKYNNNKFLKNEIINFIYEFVDIIYNYFNEDKIMDNIYVRGFMYIIKSSSYFDQVSNLDKNLVQGIYSEYVDPTQQPTNEDIDAIDDINEENEALDIDGEYDFEGEYQKIMDMIDPQIV